LGFRPYLADARHAVRSRNVDGGKGGIRTHGHLSASSVFKTDALNRSATFPSFDYTPAEPN
jgi:hypothetical protein